MKLSFDQSVLFLKYLAWSGLSTTLALIAIALPSFLSLAQPGWTQPAPVATASSPSQTGLTVPSLWWTAEQFGGNLLVNWLAYAEEGNTSRRIELVVRREAWRPLGYVDRYAFVNHFGTVARDYGYNLRIVDQEQDRLATYTCNFRGASPQYLAGVRDFRGRPVPDYVPRQNSDPLACRVRLDPFIL